MAISGRKVSKVLGPVVWKKFKKNYREYRRECGEAGFCNTSTMFEAESVSQVIRCGFIWSSTPEGHDFWCEQHKKAGGWPI